MGLEADACDVAAGDLVGGKGLAVFVGEWRTAKQSRWLVRAKP